MNLLFIVISYDVIYYFFLERREKRGKRKRGRKRK
jgi:hypothetical protein